MAQRISLKDVARAAGLSHMTVSRVVRGERTVKAATVAKVERFLQKLGYQPDPALSALAAYRTRKRARARASGNVLAFILREKRSYDLLLLEGAQAEASGLGYAVEAFPQPTALAAQRQLGRLLFHRGIRGLMLGPSDTPRRLEGWDWQYFAAVAMGALQHEPALHAVAMDYFQGLQTAYLRLQEMGHRRIGLMLQSQVDERTNHLWLGAYLAVAKPVVVPLLFQSFGRWPVFLRDWLRVHRPDAVLTIHADWHDRLERAGVRCVYLNDLSPPPGAPHVRLDPRNIGRESVQLVHRLLLRQELGLPRLPQMILLRGEWVAGQETD